MARPSKNSEKNRLEQIVLAFKSFGNDSDDNDGVSDRFPLSVDVVRQALEESLVNAYQKQYDRDAIARASVNTETGEIKLVNIKMVVEEVEDDLLEIDLEEANKNGGNYSVGDEYEIPVNINKDLVRSSAMHVKTVLKQKLREAEKEAIYNAFKDKKDEIITAKIEKIGGEGRFVLLDLGQAHAILPSSLGIEGEVYNPGDVISVYVTDVNKDSKGCPIVVSRKDPNFLKRLMEKEIEEIRKGTIEIRGIAREAGQRSKVAVVSHNENIEAIGSCVGKESLRIRSISESLHNERIDIIQYDERIEFYIAAALKPAEVFGMAIDKDNRSAVVIVANEDDHKTAIGKKGQNARLAVRLTGYRIDVKTIEEAYNKGIKFLRMSEIEESYKASKKVEENYDPFYENRDSYVSDDTNEVIENTNDVVVETKEEPTVEVKPEVKTKIKTSSIYQSSQFSYTSSLEEPTAAKEVKKEVKPEVKKEVKPEVKKEVKEEKETPKNYMPIYNEQEMQEFEDEDDNDLTKYDDFDEEDYDQYDEYYDED